MKRFIQIVALALGILLIAEPALANASCSRPNCGSDHLTVNCCMHAGGMPLHGVSSNDARYVMYAMSSPSAGRQMTWRAALNEPRFIAEVSCSSGVLSVPQLAASTAKCSVVDTFTTSFDAGADPVRVHPEPVRIKVLAAASAKYILFHDFRI